MKKILSLLVVLAAPLLSHAAATYSYVAATGDIRTVEAPTAEVAIATAPNRMVHSGVVLGVLGGDDFKAVTMYQYIDEEGRVDSIAANDASEALAMSEYNRAETSGVVNSEETTIPSDMKVALR